MADCINCKTECRTGFVCVPCTAVMLVCAEIELFFGQGQATVDGVDDWQRHAIHSAADLGELAQRRGSELLLKLARKITATFSRLIAEIGFKDDPVQRAALIRKHHTDPFTRAVELAKRNGTATARARKANEPVPELDTFF